MEFELQPGDYIPTSEVPADKRQAVIDAFVAAGAINSGIWAIDVRDFSVYSYVAWQTDTNEFDATEICLDRRVTLEQILGEQSQSWDEVGPELLAALDRLVVAAERSEICDDIVYDNQSVMDEARAAITKARRIK